MTTFLLATIGASIGSFTAIRIMRRLRERAERNRRNAEIANRFNVHWPPMFRPDEITIIDTNVNERGEVVCGEPRHP